VPGPVRCLPSRARDAPPSRGAGRHPGAHGAAAVGQPRVARGCWEGAISGPAAGLACARPSKRSASLAFADQQHCW